MKHLNYFFGEFFFGFVFIEEIVKIVYFLCSLYQLSKKMKISSIFFTIKSEN